MRFIQFLRNNTVTLMYCFALLVLAKVGYADDDPFSSFNTKSTDFTGWLQTGIGPAIVTVALFYLGVKKMFFNWDWGHAMRVFSGGVVCGIAAQIAAWLFKH